jgi:hypothetical protein
MCRYPQKLLLQATLDGLRVGTNIKGYLQNVVGNSDFPHAGISAVLCKIWLEQAPLGTAAKRPEPPLVRL